MEKDLTRAQNIFAEIFGDIFGPQPKDDFPVDITENESSFNLIAEFPGIAKEDISVDFNEGVLYLKAIKKVSIAEEEERFLQKESYYGAMERSFSVGEIDTDNITATFNNGILKVSLKKKELNFKKIEIG